MTNSALKDISLLVLGGPTASGKSELAIRLAKRVNGAVVTADSMQVYRGLDIGTAKPSAADLAEVPHHLLDLLDIGERLDVYRYEKMALEAIRSVHASGRVPILAGGSGMYLRAIVYGLDPLPENPELRQHLEIRYAGNKGNERLSKLLSRLEPEVTARWPADRRKLLRALEVRQLTGQSILQLRKTWSAPPRFRILSWYLSPDREWLRSRIELRVAQMLAEGWIEETRRMVDKGLLDSPTARQALGYPIIAEYLRGEINFETMRSRVATATWQLARRQMTWFARQHPEAKPLPIPIREQALEQIVGEICQFLDKRVENLAPRI